MIFEKEFNLSDVSENVLSKMKDLHEPNRSEVVLDISSLPFVKVIIEAKPKIIWLPDTLEKLLILARERPEYHKILTRLFRQWTRRKIDIDWLSEIISKRKFEETRIKLITVEDVDTRVYALFLERLIKRDLMIELSPRLNILGDIVGKIIGGAQKLKRAILLANRALQRMARKLIPVLDVANVLVDAKTSFLETNLHLPLRRTRRVRWLIGITVGVLISPTGIMLGLLDP